MGVARDNREVERLRLGDIDGKEKEARMSCRLLASMTGRRCVAACDQAPGEGGAAWGAEGSAGLERLGSRLPGPGGGVPMSLWLLTLAQRDVGTLAHNVESLLAWRLREDTTWGHRGPDIWGKQI